MTFSALYKTREWQEIRKARLLEEPLCRFHKTQGKIVAATVVDHIKPHKGDPALFYCYANTQSLCKRCHDSIKQQIERNGYFKATGTDGYPIDPNHPAYRTGGRV